MIVALGGDDQVVGNGGFDLVCAGDGNDSVSGNSGEQSFIDVAAVSGDAGDDRIQAGADTVVLADYEDSPAPVTVDLGAGTATGWGSDTLIGIRLVFGSRFDDSLTGSDGFDVLDGSAGNDVISGRGGGDYLMGESGDDSIDGGPGRDLLDYEEAPNGVRVNLATGRASGWGADTLRSIEQVHGSARADVLTGGRGADDLEGRGGSDRLAGGAGKDRLYGGNGKDRADGGPARDVCRAERTVRCP